MKINKFVTSLSIATVLFSCTDLVVKEKDSLVIKTESGVFSGVNPTSTLSSAYGDLRGFADQANLYALNEISSDELLVPTRGTDWGDNGVWRTLHQHTWDQTHTMVRDTWNNLNSNVFKLGQLLSPESNASPVQVAEGKFLRAYNMFLLLDLFRQIPQRGVNEGPEINPKVLSVQESFDFIAKDLADAIPVLPVGTPGGNNGNLKATRAAANYLQAKLFLNKHIYFNTTAAAADMTKVITSVDAITADGYTLADGTTSDKYFALFSSTGDSETIFWTDAGVGNRMWCGLHYNQPQIGNTGGGWNGFSTYADFYAKFDDSSLGDQFTNAPGTGQEPRRGYVPSAARSGGVRDIDSNTGGVQIGAQLGYGFLVGQQFDDNGTALKDRAGNPLIFNKDFAGLAGNNEKTGIRILKYHPDYGSFTSHYILFRYADAHLMKIEAILRGGTSSDSPQTLFDNLRTKRGASTTITVASAGDLPKVLDERARELYIEGWRRNDQIRFGTFNVAYGYMTNTESYRSVYPIPALAVSSNPNLKQNPGY